MLSLTAIYIDSYSFIALSPSSPCEPQVFVPIDFVMNYASSAKVATLL